MRYHDSLLEFRHGRYLKVALLVMTASIAAYACQEWITAFMAPYVTRYLGVTPVTYFKPYGGTLVGYTLGTIAALLILWLMLLGLRKRRYRSSIGSLQGWTSAHVYLGVTLIVIATLHCAFEFGWNLHTFFYAVMIVVIVSGIIGVYTYLRYPRMMTDNLGDETLETLILKIADLDRECQSIALNLPDEVNKVVLKARKTRIGGSFRRQLAGNAVRCPTRAACAELPALGKRFTGDQARINQQLLGAMVRKNALVVRARRDLRLQALMQLWLYVHVPLSFTLLAAMIAHVVSVFYFW